MGDSMKPDYTRRGEEPPLADMIDDPIIRLLMKSDGVSIGALLPLIEEVSDKVAGEDSRSTAA